MFDLHVAFENFSPEIDLADSAIDHDFIIAFLTPYFRDLPREELAGKVAEVISRELDSTAALSRRR